MSTTIVPGQLLTTATEVEAFMSQQYEGDGLVLFVIADDGDDWIGPATVDSIDPDGTIEIVSCDTYFWQRGVLWHADGWSWPPRFADAVATDTKLMAWADDGSRPADD